MRLSGRFDESARIRWRERTVSVSARGNCGRRTGREWHFPGMADDRSDDHQPPRAELRPVSAAHFQTGTGCSTVFWVVVAAPFAIVGLFSSGLLSNIFYGIAAFFGLLMLVNLAYYVTG